MMCTLSGDNMFTFDRLLKSLFLYPLAMAGLWAPPIGFLEGVLYKCNEFNELLYPDVVAKPAVWYSRDEINVDAY